MNTKETLTWVEKDCLASEPVFIPSPNAVKEDEGIVLSSVIAFNGTRSFLLFLDGQTMKELARAHVPNRLAPLVHGEFLSSN